MTDDELRALAEAARVHVDAQTWSVFWHAASPAVVLSLLDRLAAADECCDLRLEELSRVRAAMVSAERERDDARLKYRALDEETRAWRDQWSSERDAAVARAEAAERVVEAARTCVYGNGCDSSLVLNAAMAKAVADHDALVVSRRRAEEAVRKP